MLLEATQSFELRHPGTSQDALHFVRTPAVALSQLRFIRGLDTKQEQVRGELIVPVAMLGDVDLPFSSRLQSTPDGAVLLAAELPDERAWVEVNGQATVDSQNKMSFAFQLRAHLQLPEAEGWGSAAFEKMVRAAANRTLERIAAALPGGIQAALEQSRASA